jgi:hypothetical protein
MNNMTMQGIQPITIGDIYGNQTQKKFPNKKVSINIHGANNGYIVEVEQGYGVENELYIINKDQDLGTEIGKIITHNALSNRHE